MKSIRQRRRSSSKLSCRKWTRTRMGLSHSKSSKLPDSPLCLTSQEWELRDTITTSRAVRRFALFLCVQESDGYVLRVEFFLHHEGISLPNFNQPVLSLHHHPLQSNTTRHRKPRPMNHITTLKILNTSHLTRRSNSPKPSARLNSRVSASRRLSPSTKFLKKTRTQLLLHLNLPPTTPMFPLMARLPSNLRRRSLRYRERSLRIPTLRYDSVRPKRRARSMVSGVVAKAVTSSQVALPRK